MSEWTPHQRAMLQEMGIRLWSPPAPEDAHEAQVPEPVQAVSPEQPFTATPLESVPARELRHVPLRPSPEVRRTEPVERAPLVSPPASTGATAGLDWPALEAAVQSCQACALSQSRRQTVFGVGHRQAHWMLVGEAPGEQEDLQGEPFVGKAGQLLDQMLRAVGLTRAEAPPEQQVYIANVLKCRPPGNRNPDPQEVQRCLPFLQRQVELVQPRLILALGRFAVQALLGSAEPIGRLRGKVHRYQGVPVVVSYHPAYLLRNPLDKARAWEDLCLAAEVHRQAGPSADGG